MELNLALSSGPIWCTISVDLAPVPGLFHGYNVKDFEMPVPKRKVSHSRKRKRSSNKGIKPRSFTKCKNCEEVTMPHQVCQTCGYYKGKKILATKADRAVKRDEGKKAKEKKELEGSK